MSATTDAPSRVGEEGFPQAPRPGSPPRLLWALATGGPQASVVAIVGLVRRRPMRAVTLRSWRARPGGPCSELMARGSTDAHMPRRARGKTVALL